MKRLFTFFCAALVVLSASAVPALTQKVLSTQKLEVKQAPRLAKAEAIKNIARAPKAKADATPLASGTFYTAGGTLYVNTSSGWADYTSQIPSVEVTVDGANVTIVGLAYYFEDGAVTGTLEGNTLTIPSGQLVGTDSSGDEFLVGSNDGSTVSDIVFVYDPDAQTLTASTKFICESASATEVQVYAYWYNAAFSATEPEAPQLVVLPDGATAEAYVMDYFNSSSEACAKLVNVAVVEDSVYFQGMSENIPTSWVKGIKAGDQVTFAANQFMGEAEGYESYAFYSGEAVFTFDSEENKYSALGEIYGVLGGRWYDGRYTNPVLTKSKEPDFDNPIEVTITDVAYKYDSEYQDVIYELSNASADTVVVLDIKLASGEDIELGVTYTLADMYPEATYTYLEIGGSKSALQSISFVKQNVSGDFFSVEATLVDAKSNVFHLTGIFEDVPPVAYEPVVVPAGLETAMYKFVGIDTYYDSEETKYIQVGFDEDTVYFQGLSYYVPEGWIKGTVAADDGSVTLDPCLVGLFSYFGYEFNVIFGGGSMQYDAALDQFTCAEFITVDEEGNNFDEYSNVIITRFTEVAATPADPKFDGFVFADATYPKVNFTIPLEGTNGEDLNPEKLSYIFFTDKSGTIAELVLDPSEYTKLTAPMTEIPYNFSDDWDIYNYVLYLNQSEEEVRSWSRLGLQSIYRGAGEENKSNVVWFDVAAYWAEVDGPAEGIEETLAEGKAVKVVRDNQIIILKGDKAFNAVGNRVK